MERWTPKLKQEQCLPGLTLRMWTDKDGEYVLYADAQAELAEKDKEIEGLKKSYRELENNYVMQGAIYEGISDLLRDGGTSDFMMSFPIVSQIADLLSEISLKQICIDEARRDAKAEIAALKAENERLREALEKALPRMAHRFECVSVLPSEMWHQSGSTSLDSCVCEIKAVKAALAGKE